MGSNMAEIKDLAQMLCEDEGYSPYSLEPGDLPEIDGICPNGDPGHYLWREFIPSAKKVLRALQE